MLFPTLNRRQKARIRRNVTRAAYFAVGTGAVVAGALTLYRWCFDVEELDAVHYIVYPSKNPLSAWSFFATAAAATAAAMIAGKLAPRMMWGRKLLPALLLWPLMALPANFFNLAAGLAVTAWCMERCLGERMHLPRLSPLSAGFLAGLMAAVAAAWSFYHQSCAYASLFLAYGDWGDYAECYLRLIAGQQPLRAYLVQAGHFNFLPNVLMTAVLRLWRAPEAVFLTTALLLGTLPVLAYRLGRVWRLPRSAALAGAAVAAFNPILVNQTLSFCYGFHPVLFLGPAILIFFICERRKCRIGMAAAVLLSLLVQETAAVLWTGYALYLFSRRKFIPGAILGAFCVTVFMLISKAVIPFASTAASNPQLFHYAQLGDSLLEVILSPVLRPRAVLATLGQYQNLYFISALLLPCGVLALRSPRRLLIGLPLLAGVLLQDSPHLKNPAMQYGFEISLIILAASIAAAGGLLCRRNEPGKRTFRAGVRTMTAMTLLCAACWGRLPFGLYSARPILKRPSAEKIIETFRRISGDGGRLLATDRLRLHFMFDRSTAGLNAAMLPGDTVILDFDDVWESVTAVRRRLIADLRAVPVSTVCFYGQLFAIWKIAREEISRPALPFIFRLDSENFAAAGKPLPQNDPAFEARLARVPNGDALLLVKVCKKVPYDTVIELKIPENGRDVRMKFRFGRGVYPAWQASPGEIYAEPIPDAFAESVQLQLRLLRDE